LKIEDSLGTLGRIFNPSDVVVYEEFQKTLNTLDANSLRSKYIKYIKYITYTEYIKCTEYMLKH